MWVGSLPDGEYLSVERESSEAALTGVFDELRVLGSGYLEVRHADSYFPALTIGFRAEHGVVQRFDSAESISILHGDGTILCEAAVEVPVMTDSVTFSGEFVSSLDRSWTVVHQFLLRNEIPGTWSLL